MLWNILLFLPNFEPSLSQIKRRTFECLATNYEVVQAVGEPDVRGFRAENLHWTGYVVRMPKRENPRMILFKER